MEEQGVGGSFTVEITLNGITDSFQFSIASTRTIEDVKNEIRGTYNVTGGTLSSRNDQIVIVDGFVAGGVYIISSGLKYDQVTLFIIICSYQFVYSYPPLSLLPTPSDRRDYWRYIIGR